MNRAQMYAISICTPPALSVAQVSRYGEDMIYESILNDSQPGINRKAQFVLTIERDSRSAHILSLRSRYYARKQVVSFYEQGNTITPSKMKHKFVNQDPVKPSSLHVSHHFQPRLHKLSLHIL